MHKLYISLLLTGACLNASAQVPWDFTQDMGATRTQHVAVALSADSVMVAGGWNFTTNLASAEIYNAMTDTWTPTLNDMSSAHTTGAAVKLNNGNVMVIGGYDGGSNVVVCDLYDHTTGMWQITGSLTTGRSYHTATLLNNGKILVTGGYTGTENTADCELYDPASGTWDLTGSLTTGRSYHTATLLNDGRVLVAGGYNPSAGFQLNTVEIYDPVTETWTLANPMGDARAWHSASLLDDGRVMVAGGEFFTGGTPFAYDGLSSSEVFNPATGAWSDLADMPAGLCYNQQFTLHGSGLVLVIAGQEHTDYGSGFTSEPGVTCFYAVSTNTWLPNPMNIDGRLQFAAAQMGPTSIMVTGGDDNTTEMLKFALGVNENKHENAMGLYPNPATETAIVQLDEAAAGYTITLTDMQGKTFTPGITLNQNTAILQLQKIPAGVYVVKAQHDQKSFVQRLTVVK